MNHLIDRMEIQLERFVENALAKMTRSVFSPADAAAQLARALNEGVRLTEDGKRFAPDRYALTCHPEDAKELLERTPDLQKVLANELLEVARDFGYLVFREPVITIAADPTLSHREVRVVAWHSTSPLEFTRGMERMEKVGGNDLPVGAYLIVDGNRHFPLDRPVVNIGRRLDNHLILEDPRVSRTHAQIRAREGRYEIFDLNSSAGTRINGRAVQHHVLQPGDVIDVAGIRLVYGEDPGGPPDETPAYAPPFPPRPAGDQRTRVIDKDGKNTPDEE